MNSPLRLEGLGEQRDTMITDGADGKLLSF
jgi:hypothetical protein